MQSSMQPATRSNPLALLPSSALGGRLDANKEPMRGNIESAAVIAPTAIASKLVCEYGAEVVAGRSDHQDASGTGSPDVTLRV